jgi:hypothetical protein
MADNLTMTGATFAFDVIDGVAYQRVKLTIGADGVATDVSAGAGVVGTGTQRMTLANDDPAVASLAIMDDWDETNRCAVNLIAGQVAITAGAGTVAANTPRVTLGSDDPAVASLSVLDDWDETNRCAVNLIAGQVGVAGGAGAVGATVPRVTVATDDGLHTKIGEVQASPTANTVLARLKAIADGTVLAAGTALAGKVSAGADSSTIYNGATALTPKFAAIALSATGTAVAVLSANLSASAAVNAKWQSHTAGDISGLTYFAAAGDNIVLPYNPLGYFETVAGEALDLNLSGSVAVGGGVVYIEV